MKLAAIADIHGNCLALEAVLADIKQMGAALTVNLGDHVSGPLEAARTAELLMALGLPSIRGNHDRSLVDTPPDRLGASDSAANTELTVEQKNWLGSLSPTLIVKDEVFLCHGTPSSDTDYWLESVTADGNVVTTPIETIEQAAEDVDFPLILCGHTHIPRAIRLRDGRMVVNPGSVGCPAYLDDSPVEHRVETGTPDACYALLEKRDGQWSVCFRHVRYDHLAMAEMARKAGRPSWASALATGWIR